MSQKINYTVLLGWICSHRILLHPYFCCAIANFRRYLNSTFICYSLLIHLVLLFIRLVVHQLAQIIVHIIFLMMLPQDGSIHPYLNRARLWQREKVTYKRYGKYVIINSAQYVCSYIGRWIINNSGSLTDIALITLASSLQQGISLFLICFPFVI